MPKSVISYDLLISCPGDVQTEIDIVESVVNKFNELYMGPLGISIRTRHWRKSSYAQSGGKPQALLNEQFVNECDAAVAIFWTRYGSPTDKYGSGTEEEVEIMLQSGKQVFMYFSDKPIQPSQMKNAGYQEIQAFKEKYRDRGVYFTYSSDEEFEKLFFAHLSQHFLTEAKGRDTSANCSELKLMGIDENGCLSKETTICGFKLKAETSRDKYVELIRSLIADISCMNVGQRDIVDTTLLTAFIGPVEIDKEIKKTIIEVAQILEEDIPSTFFELGNLAKNSLSLNVLNGIDLRGTSEEVEKYWKIQDLHKTILETLDWVPIENAFANKRCIKMALKNDGKAIDEDIEITIELPQNVFMELSEFPSFDNEQMRYMLHDCDIGSLFGISSSAEYCGYSESIRTVRSNHVAHIECPFPGYNPDYSDAFDCELRNAFCYSVYQQNNGSYIIKLKVDYIKHNTAVAFPTVIFIKDDITEIPYKITSRNKPDIVQGVLKVCTA